MQALLALIAVALGGLCPAPVIEVRARTRLVVDEIARTHAGVHVSGMLVDSSTGTGIPGRDVALRGDNSDQRVTTGSSGRFDVLVDLAPGPHDLDLAFAGDGGYGPSRSEVRRFDVGKANVTLAVHIPAEVDAVAASVDVTVEVNPAGDTDALPITLRVGDASGPGAARAVGELRTGRDGAGHLTIPREKLGRPGEKRITARFAGDDAFNAVETEATFVVYTATQLSDLQAPTAPVAYEDDLEVTGKLLDAQGNPVSGALLGFAGADRRFAETVTDDRGRFHVKRAASDLGPGPATFVVEFVSKTPWRRGTRSTPITVEILRPRPLPLTYTIIAFLFTAAAVAAYALARSRPWRLLARWRKRDTVEAEPTLNTAAPAPLPGLVPAKPSLISTLRRAGDHVFSGRVVDLIHGTAVGGARMVLTPDLGPDAATTLAPVVIGSDAAGAFEVELTSATWRVEVVARGFVTCALTIIVPHRGELRGARIDLLPVRERVFTIYREVATRLVPSPELVTVWTPRELLEHVSARLPADALARLTTLVEQTCYAGPTPGEDTVDAALHGARAARTEQGN